MSNSAFRDSLVHAAISDIGMRRSNNQDSFTVALASDEEFWRTRGHLFIVADGMGAHAAGELASKITVDTIPLLYHKYRDTPPPEALKRALEETNTEVHRKGEANLDFHNMGTTCSAMTLVPQGALIAHIGDSRIYRLRQGLLEQLTFDHSLVWEMQAAGQIPEGSDLAASLPKNVITRSLGPNASIKVDLEGPFPLQIGDIFLMCSDGLSGQLTDEEIGVLLGVLPPHESAQALVDVANLEGGPDNITVIISKVQGPELVGGEGQAFNTPKSKQGGKGPHPAVWAAVAAIAFFAGLFAFLEMYPIAAVVGVAALGVLGFAIFQLIRGQGGATSAAPDRYGRGPHTQTKAPPNKAFSDKLVSMVDKLKETAIEMEWTIDYSDVDAFMQKAKHASDKGDLAAAIANQSRAISNIMRQTSTQPDKKSSDSSIDLV